MDFWFVIWWWISKDSSQFSTSLVQIPTSASLTKHFERKEKLPCHSDVYKLWKATDDVIPFSTRFKRIILAIVQSCPTNQFCWSLSMVCSWFMLRTGLVPTVGKALVTNRPVAVALVRWISLKCHQQWLEWSPVQIVCVQYQSLFKIWRVRIVMWFISSVRLAQWFGLWVLIVGP